MAANFVSASSQRLVNSASAITAYPFTIGLWAFPTTTSTARAFVSVCDTAVVDHNWSLRQGATNTFLISAQAGATVNSAGAGSVVANAWAFVVGRFISSTNRRLSVISSTGAAGHAQATTARAPTGIDTMAVGASETSVPDLFYDGLIGELWYTNTDIQPDAGQLSDAMLFQLAYGGPFSLPHIAKDIIEYRSLRKAGDFDEIGEVFHGALGRQPWINTNGVTIGRHPPLPYWYERPARTLSLWQRMSQGQFLHDPPPGWPPPSDFSQPQMYVNQGTQRW